MQQEITAALPRTEVRIIGVNRIGAEGGNPVITHDRTVPWLQDVPEAKAWKAWMAVAYDLIVVDPQGRVAFVGNTYSPDISSPVDSAAVRSYRSFRNGILEVANR